MDDLTILIIGIIVVIVLIVVVKLFFRSDLDKIYRKMVFDHFINIGFKKATAQKIAQAEYSTIKKFLDLTEIIDKHKGH